MTNKLTFLILVVLLATGCKTEQSRQDAEVVKKEVFYPYPQYLETQIAYLDTANLGIEMVTQENGITIDSGFISREKFKELAKAFMQPDPNSDALAKHYTEESFQDLSINTITFSISSKKTELPLQHADVLLNPENKQVKYIVLKKEEKTKEGIVSSSLLWRHNMNFQIVSDITSADGSKKSRLVRVVWDKPVSELTK